MFRPSPPADRDHIQDLNWHWDAGTGAFGGNRRHAPSEMPYVEWDPMQRVWIQGEHIKRNFEPNRYFTRPHDGKRPGWSGRLKDALVGEGADVFITTSGDKRTLMRDRPQKWQWTNNANPSDTIAILTDRDFRLQDLMHVRDHKFSTQRWSEPLYNFKNRQYQSLGRTYRNPGNMWPGAKWAPGAKRSAQSPWSHQDFFGQWWDRLPLNTGWWAGGRPRP